MPNWLMTLASISLGAVLVSLIIMLAVATVGVIRIMKEMW